MVSRSCGNSALYWFSLAERRAPWQSAVLKVVSQLTPQWLQVPELRAAFFQTSRRLSSQPQAASRSCSGSCTAVPLNREWVTVGGGVAVIPQRTHFGCHTLGELLMTSSRQRLRILPNVVQCAGRPPSKESSCSQVRGVKVELTLFWRNGRRALNKLLYSD